LTNGLFVHGDKVAGQFPDTKLPFRETKLPFSETGLYWFVTAREA